MVKTTPINKHKRDKKKLIPPLAELKFSFSSWINDRLPEMIWAVVLIGNHTRDECLEFFRYLANFVSENNQCYDVTISGIGKLNMQDRKKLLLHMRSYSDSFSKTLSCIGMLESLPIQADWKEVFGTAEMEDTYKIIGNGVSKTLFHQSEEATDCRWVRLLCAIAGKKINYTMKTADSLRGIMDYPNNSDLRKIRPSIRAGEISLNIQNDSTTNWAETFWKTTFDNTKCYPEEIALHINQERKKELTEQMEADRKENNDDIIELRKKIIDHFFEYLKDTKISPRFEAIFGIILYSTTLLIEIHFYRISLAISGRIVLRTLLELLISFKYLLLSEKTNPEIWNSYRGYGTGQLKLTLLKLEELKVQPNSIITEIIDNLANEDQWIEFSTIDLGQWDSTNLRDMSEKTGLKDLYDTYYNYTSGFIHGNWGAIRESIYQGCYNPLHRLHRLPIYDLPLMPNVMEDSKMIFNMILDIFEKEYPNFPTRLNTIKRNDSKKKDVDIL